MTHQTRVPDASGNTAAGHGWLQVNESGFGYPPSLSLEQKPTLFPFGLDLYDLNDLGLFQMDRSVFRKWIRMADGTSGDWRAFGDFLYRFDTQKPDEFWYIKRGAHDWHHVAQQGLPAGCTPRPMTVFHGQMYAITKQKPADRGSEVFQVWRSPDIGKPDMRWQEVVPNSFGDPQNNHDLGFMGESNGKLYAGTETLQVFFGWWPQTGAGVEIWESPSGDPGTWVQINKDGFGTEIQLAHDDRPWRTNHVIGSWVSYKALSQNHSHLYVGTKSHQGAEVWRYDGSGENGWKNVTPEWAGVTGQPGRNESMTLFSERLYLAEGYPTGNLASHDGTNWSIEVSGPHPFDPQNGGLTSVVVHNGHLYVHAIRDLGTTQGDQVWGYPL